MSQEKLVRLDKAMDLKVNWPILQLQQGPPEEISVFKGETKTAKGGAEYPFASWFIMHFH